MAIKLNVIKCPECDAKLEIEEGRKKLFCSYCGTPIIVTDENEYIYRQIDEAKIREAEADKEVELKKLEIIEKHREATEQRRKEKNILNILVAIGAVFCVAVGCFVSDGETILYIGAFLAMAAFYIYTMNDMSEEKEIEFEEKIKVPFEISTYEHETYTEIEEILRRAGFNNIECKALDDLLVGVLVKPNTVESIRIDGKLVTGGGRKFSPNAKVIIAYHSLDD